MRMPIPVDGTFTIPMANACGHYGLREGYYHTDLAENELVKGDPHSDPSGIGMRCTSNTVRFWMRTGPARRRGVSR